MEITITKHDILWNYIAQFFNLGSGFFVLPVILHLLSPEEVGMNYLMLSVSSLVALADFGFSDQFGRNLTYVFSGAQELKKDGMSNQTCGDINYRLLAVVIETAKFIYKKISIFVLFVMLTLGSLYMFQATNGFSSVKNSIWIWILFSISTYFNIYFKYYSTLLTGAAMIMESKKALMLNRMGYIFISFLFLFLGFGLISIVFANFISPFIGRWYSYCQFYNKELQNHLKGINPRKDEIKETFNILWYNAKKLGINFVGAYGIQQSGTFIIGFFLSLEEIGSYGLMCQLFQISAALSLGVFTSYLPIFYKERVDGNISKLVIDFSFSVFIFIIIFTSCGLLILFWGDEILSLISSQTMLPVSSVLFIYFVHMFLENYHSICATMIVTNNQVPFVKAAIYSGILVILCNISTLKFTELGLFGVVLGQLIVQSIYNHWKWPLWIFKEFRLNPMKIICIGGNELCRIATSTKSFNR